MIFDYSDEGVVHIDMAKYVEEMLNDFPVKLTEDMTAETPAAANLFDTGNEKRKLNAEKREAMHSCVAKGLYLAKRGRPDIYLAVRYYLHV